MSRDRRDSQTLDLLNWRPAPVAVTYAGEEALDVRGATISARFAKAISKTLRECEKDRATIAKEISDYLGEAVTKTMLDAYASEARDSHNINLPRFAALVHVTGDNRLLSLLPEMFGFAVVDEKYTSIIELHLIEEHERDVAKRKASLQGQWSRSR